MIEAEEIATRAGYSRPHTFHCGPNAIYVSAMGGAHGGGPGGVFLLDHESFDVLGQWEVDRGPQFLAYDFWWHIGYDVAITSEWGTPDMFENGLSLERLVNTTAIGCTCGTCASAAIPGNRPSREEHQMALELRPAHDPTKAYGFVCTVIWTKDLSAGIWLWHRENGNGKWAARRVIEIPGGRQPGFAATAAQAVQGRAAAGPEIALSLDDKYLYASCWGTGELKQYDVQRSVSSAPDRLGAYRRDGLAHAASQGRQGQRRATNPQDDRDWPPHTVTNSLSSALDEQFYPEGIGGSIVKVDVNPAGGIALDPNFFIPFEGERPHQIHLEGGDCSSDSFCYP